ncbi:MAG: peptide chain release factor 1 [Christensenellales bacterium]
MQEKFDALCARFEELSLTASQPDVIADQPRYQALVKEIAELGPVVSAWKSFQALEEEMAVTRELAEIPEFADIAREELTALEEKSQAAKDELRLMLLPKDADDDRNVVIEIRAGAGGDEASLFGAALMRMYTRYAERNGFEVSYISLSDTELGGVKEAVFSLSGQGAFSRMKYESGVHRIQRVPSTESQGRIHTSTATVAVLPEANEVDIQINPGDLRIDTYRASGQGGQHVNRTDSAVRITHLPTGLVVTCQDEKSQLKNKEQALKVLRSRLYEQKQAEQDALYAQHRRGQIGTGDRSERIRTYNFPQGRVTDHRIGLTLYQIDLIMDGDLDPIIDALAMDARQKALAESVI